MPPHSLALALNLIGFIDLALTPSLQRPTAPCHRSLKTLARQGFMLILAHSQVEDGAIGLTFNSKLTMKMCGSNLNTGLVANPIGHVHVAPGLHSTRGSFPQVLAHAPLIVGRSVLIRPM